MRPKITVVGGGFKGIVAAKYLADQGVDTVLIEQGRNLGGVHFSIPWDGFQLDLGCHLFSNEDNRTTQLLFDLLGEEPVGINPLLKSIYQGKETHGIEYPDFTSLPSEQVADCLVDLLEHVAEKQFAILDKPTLERNLASYLVGRYGAKVADLLNRALEKMLLTDAKELSSVAFSAIPARRISLVNAELASLLKTVPLLDELILKSSSDDPMKYVRDKASGFDCRCFYPANGGMGAFSSASRQHLADIGVTIKTETSIDKIEKIGAQRINLKLADSEELACDYVFWTSGSQTLSDTLGLNIDLSEHIHLVAMVIFYFDVPQNSIGPYSWIQNFDRDDLVYRASAPSAFGNGTAPEGRAYVAAEITTGHDSDIYLNPESYVHRVWQEVVKLGVSEGDMPDHYKIIKTPVSYKFPKASFAQAVAGLNDHLNDYPGLRLFDEWIFGKSASVNEIVTAIDTMKILGDC
ncbi:FAD-dependent oxidoreductase [Methylobacillus arboreus]|uniref:protoporphyrinogen/coproporphyrinogen oxidase n=1 Tax=Methylobacillus arboreus TaxID=755170 RepID=UPI001E393308|nr:FAD-dependent oxidoreductase [Methylobacillus arboreus]MCB5189975.1 FAD-dependent oxidoreductase [Methylobacillus arboreus]